MYLRLYEFLKKDTQNGGWALVVLIAFVIVAFMVGLLATPNTFWASLILWPVVLLVGPLIFLFGNDQN